MKNTLLLLFAGLLFCFQALGQDSLRLLFRQLGREDLNVAKENASQEVASSSRSLKDIKDLPFTIYIITKEDIQKYGYITLADALESLPGIRVAKSGSGGLGELFLMRGLLGNTHTKILINDLPIKPTAVEGMPLGAQLPIQQAERIEVTFGPVIGIYGGDAMAGVVNIITTQTDRPFYVQSDVALGSQGYSNLSVLLAGKVGWDKDVVKFGIFGSYTNFNDRRIVYDKENLYRTKTYAKEGSTFFRLNNYQGAPDNPVFKDIPHQSKLIGAQLDYKIFRFHFEQLERQDHSAIGLNPITVSYANPSTYIKEKISRLNAGILIEKEKWSFRLDATGILYQLDPSSSTLLLENSLFQGLQNVNARLTNPVDSATINKNAELVYQQLLSNQRFSYASSNDLYIEPLYTGRVADWLEFSLGGSFQFSDNQPYIGYLPVPFEPDIAQNAQERRLGLQTIAYQPEKEQFSNIAFYFQQYFRFGKANILGAVRYDSHSKYKGIWSGYLAGSYKLTDELSARASFSRAFQMPNTYWEASSLAITYFEDSIRLSSAYRFGHPELDYIRNRSFEVGLRWGSKDNFETDLAYFRMTTNNLIAERQYLAVMDPLILIDAYQNDEAATIHLNGVQARVKVGLGERINGYLTLQRAKGKETLPFGGGTLDEVREQPKWTWQTKLVTQLGQKIFLHGTLTSSQRWISRNLTNTTLLEEETIKSNYIVPKYAIFDLMLRYQLNDDFQGFMKGFNLFNRNYYGIQTGRSEENLIYNPQAQLTFIVGLNYRMK